MKERLLRKIEGMRKMLNVEADKKRLCDPEVVALSQRLDKLLNEYDVLSKATAKDSLRL